jgi:hypothetical protein
LSVLKLIEQRRGSIEILDPEGLTDAACDCYGIVNEYTARVSGLTKP